jgi:hypothetical protein
MQYVCKILSNIIGTAILYNYSNVVYWEFIVVIAVGLVVGVLLGVLFPLSQFVVGYYCGVVIAGCITAYYTTEFETAGKKCPCEIFKYAGINPIHK